MIYSMYIVLVMLLLYKTPPWDSAIGFMSRNPKLLSMLFSILVIFGDAIFMVGGGVLATEYMSMIVDAKNSDIDVAVDLLTLLKQDGTIMIICGAIIRETFKALKDIYKRR